MTENPYAAELGRRDPLTALKETPAQITAIATAWSPAQFDRSYSPGKWTARQILIHLAQTELVLGTRARMAVSTPNYVAQPFDQDVWIKKEAGLDGRYALDAFLGVAAMNHIFFASLSAADRASGLAHPEYGDLTVDWILGQIAGHQIHHLKQLEGIARA